MNGRRAEPAAGGTTAGRIGGDDGACAVPRGVIVQGAVACDPPHVPSTFSDLCGEPERF